MPRPEPPKEYRWKPGQSGNARGRLPYTNAERAFRKLTRQRIRKIGSRLIQMTPAEIVAFAHAPDSTLIEAMFVALAKKVIEKGDPIAFEKLLDRVVGKATNEIALSMPVKGPVDLELENKLLADEKYFNLMVQAEQRAWELRNEAKAQGN